MLHPLASLWRHSCRVTFYESGAAASSSAPDAQAGGQAVRRRFRSQDEAITYLRYWAGDPGAQADLRWMVQRLGASISVARQSTSPWLEPLAGLLVAGTITAMEETARRAMPGRIVPAPSAGAAQALDSMPALSSLPQTPVMPNLLPVLEDINVEGAEVLPELEQAMAQVKASIELVDTAGASLEPAPGKVAEIMAAMDRAATESAQGLDQA
jgi:hypothetical protein